MAGCVKQSTKIVKNLAFLQSAPILHTSTPSFFCTVASTGDTIDGEATGKKKSAKGEDKEEQEEGGYGDAQRKPGDAANKAHSEWEKAGSSSEHKESLADTGFDMSKRTKPSGDE